MNVHARFEDNEQAEAMRHRRNAMSSQLLLRRLCQHHFEHAPDRYKDRFLPVVHRDIFRELFDKARADRAADASAAIRRRNEFLQKEAVVKEEPFVSEIIAATAAYTGLATVHIMSIRRNKQYVRARHIVMYLARELTVRTMQDIGLRLGGRDHSTVVHGAMKMERQMQDDPELRNTVRQIASAIGHPLP